MLEDLRQKSTENLKFFSSFSNG